MLLDFLDKKSHRHLIAAHKKAELTWSVKPPQLSVQYQSKHQLTSAGFRAPVLLELGQEYELTLDCQLVTGDPAFIHIETEDGQRLIPRYKIHPSKQWFHFQQRFEVPCQLQNIYLGILFFYPDQDYQLIIRKFTLQRVDRLTPNNLNQIATTISSPKSRIIKKKTTASLHQNKKKNIPIEASNVTLTPSEHQWVADNQSLRSELQLAAVQPHDHLSVITDLPPTTGDWNESVSVDQSPTSQPMPTSQPFSIPPPDPIEDLRRRYKNTPIVVSLTTVPQRLNKLRSVIESLLKQSLPIKYIYLNIPHRYKRYDKPYLNKIKWPQVNSKIIVHRCPDWGPITKIMGLMDQPSVTPDTLILTADDDQYYPPDWAYYLSYWPLQKPNLKAFFGLKGYQAGRVVTCSQPKTTQLNLDWITGEWGWVGYRKWIRQPNQILRQIQISPEALYSDDILLANGLAEHRVARLLAPGVPKSRAAPTPTSWSQDHWSLHRFSGSRDHRYNSLLTILKDKKRYHLHQPGPKLTVRQLTNDQPTIVPLTAPTVGDQQPPPTLIQIDVPQTTRKVLVPPAPFISAGPTPSVSSGATAPSVSSGATASVSSGATAPSVSSGATASVSSGATASVSSGATAPSVSSGAVTPSVSSGLVPIPGPVTLSSPILNFYQPNYQNPSQNLNWNMLHQKKILYISHWTELENYQLVLLYIRKLPMARLYFPAWEQSAPSLVTLPSAYLSHLPDQTEDLWTTHYDLVMIDLPWFRQTQLPTLPSKLKNSGPVFYICRYPELGLTNQVTQHRLTKSLIVNANFYPMIKSPIVWRMLPDIEAQELHSKRWSAKWKHACCIIGDDQPLNHLPLLLDSWKKFSNHASQQFFFNWKLHLGIIPKLALIVQQYINDHNIPNIYVYNQVKFFGTLIQQSAYYLTLATHLDYYAIWAYQQKKKVCLMNWGEFTKYQEVMRIPYQLGVLKICPKQSAHLWGDLHQKCPTDHCTYWLHQEIAGCPIPDTNQMIELLVEA